MLISRPNSTAKVFNKVIIDVPLLQLMTLCLSMGTLALEYPLPQVSPACPLKVRAEG
jgi:hypothetical protein